jgi:cytidylate kinase
MRLPSVIAIDGPAASGKSTLAKMLAERLGYLYFDTGIMYRAVTFVALQKGISVESEEALTCLAKQSHIDVKQPSKHDGRSNDILIDGQDVTWEIRQSNVDANVSIVSAYAGVRLALSEKQRQIGLQGKVVMVGRDIGTIVLPEAGFKFYLDASVEERARRRFTELEGRGIQVDFESILASIKERDRIDSSRQVAPLRIGEDAIVINTDGLSIDQVFKKMLRFIEYDGPRI